MSLARAWPIVRLSMAELRTAVRCFSQESRNVCGVPAIATALTSRAVDLPLLPCRWGLGAQTQIPAGAEILVAGDFSLLRTQHCAHSEGAYQSSGISVSTIPSMSSPILRSE